MADVISDADRKLIDAAVEAGRVQRIPYGVRELTKSEYTFSSRSNRLVYSDNKQSKARLRAANQWGRGVYRTMQGKD